MFPAGGSPDIQARLLGQWLSEHLGQPFIVENRPGGGTNIATEAVVRSAPDGHTLLLATAINTWNAALYEKLNFDFIRDIAPVAGLNRQTFVMMVPPSFPSEDRSRIHRLCKGQPRKNQYGVCRERDRGACGRRAVQDDGRRRHAPCAISGSAAGAGRSYHRQVVQVFFDPIPSSIEQIKKGGNLRGLAVTSTTRAEAFPDIPPMSEFLPGFEANGWQGDWSAEKHTG